MIADRSPGLDEGLEMREAISKFLQRSILIVTRATRPRHGLMKRLLEKILAKGLADFPRVLGDGAVQGKTPGACRRAVIEPVESDADDAREFGAFRTIVKDLDRR